jgi:hypothetical protein
MTTPQLPEVPDSTMQRVEALVLRVERSIQDGLKEALDRLPHALLAVVEEVGQKHAAPILASVKEVLGEVLRGQTDTVVDRARAGLSDGTEFVRRRADELAEKVRAAVTEPIMQALRVHVPDYGRRFGGRAIDYAVAATLFCVAGVFLLVGTVQGLQLVGVPPYLTYILCGVAALGAGLMFLRLYARGSRGPGGAGGAAKPPP